MSEKGIDLRFGVTRQGSPSQRAYLLIDAAPVTLKALLPISEPSNQAPLKEDGASEEARAVAGYVGGNSSIENMSLGLGSAEISYQPGTNWTEWSRAAVAELFVNAGVAARVTE